MEERVDIADLTLVVGPLHRLGRRLGLVRGGTNTVPLGLALGLLAWGVLLVLALLEGFGPRIVSLSVIGTHVRLLLAIPLFFVCESWWNPVLPVFVRGIVRSGSCPRPRSRPWSRTSGARTGGRTPGLGKRCACRW